MQDSGTFFACFLEIRYFLCHIVQLIALTHMHVSSYGRQIAIGVRRSIWKAIRVGQQLYKKSSFGVFSPLV